MNKYKTIHETPLRAAMDFFNLGSELAKDLKNNSYSDLIINNRSGYSSTSIARMSSDMTLVYPVLCSNMLSIDSAMMISKAIERKMVVMLQILFSAFQLQDSKDALDILSKFHRNIKIGKGTVDDFIKVASSFNDSAVVVNDARLKLLSKEFKENAFFTFEESNINDKSLMDMYKVSNKRIFKEARSRNDILNSLDDMMRKANNAVSKSSSSSMLKDIKDINDTFSKQLLSSDINKANELVPTTMVVNFKSYDSNGNVANMDNILIGVKARLIPVDSNDIVNHILTKIEDKNFITQLIRATTREISFVKDFLLAIDKAKIEALANSRKGSSDPMWKVLERRAIESRFRRTLGRPNSANAITTLVISQEEVEYVKKNYSINMESIKMMNSVLEAYNLIGLVIVDENLEIAKFHFDTGEDMWETLAFTSLEKENKDNSYKKIVNLMTKVSR